MFRQLFPPELIDAIIDASAKDKETLKALSVISKSHVSQSRKYIFRSVEFSTDDGEDVLAERHEKLCSILDRDPYVETYVRKLSIRDIQPFNGPLPWMIANSSFHRTLSRLGSRLTRFTFFVEGYEWPSFPSSLKLAFMAIFTSPTLHSLSLQGLDAVPSACCEAFGAHVTELSLIVSNFTPLVDPDLPIVQDKIVPPNLYWLSMEGVDEWSVIVLLNAWVPAPTNGQERPLFPNLTALSVGPTEDAFLAPLSKLMQSGRETIQYFYWDYSHGTQGMFSSSYIGRVFFLHDLLVRPLHTDSLSLHNLSKLFAITYEVTFYPEDDDDEVPDPPDHFDGLIALLRTVTPHTIQQLDLKVDFYNFEDAMWSLNYYDGWSHLNSLLDTEPFDQLIGVSVQIKLEKAFDETEMDIYNTLEERKEAVLDLLSLRLPFISEVDSFNFLFIVARQMI
ncbi:hypothetical protein C0991_008466 [Blastosporella zonata]|nr:hypothetical protein C0991_008466 [Blastosporella zonata]